MDISSGNQIEHLITSLFSNTRPVYQMLNRTPNHNIPRINLRMTPLTLFNTLTNPDGPMRQILQASFDDTGGVIKRASSGFIQSLKAPDVVHSDCNCGVCQDEIEDTQKDDLLELPCKHIYHKDCILPWFDKSNTCPICRKDFDSKEVSSTTGTDISDTNTGVGTDISDRSVDVGGGIVQLFTEILDQIQETDDGDIQEPTTMPDFGTNIFSMISGLENMARSTRMLHQNITRTSEQDRILASSLFGITIPGQPPSNDTLSDDQILQETILRSLRDSE